ncbi:hypothetical protein D1B31_18765 [Neobacillus notoginsengisoli]|uniref:PepSY domain-containing protein n=1 Tax=Neobacillus notoginsengisoli TaxID=1578198 RepID=A0A417YPP0_9BACI|nr:hypothetical protein D1B31_18765 [Neobacillus notoginsengisoli]
MILKKKWGYLTLIGTLFALSVLVGWLLFRPEGSAAKELSKEEAKKLIENRYGGNVSSVKAEKEMYFAKMDFQNNSYKLSVDAKTGKILAIDPIGTKKEGGHPPSLSEDEIKTILLSKAQGELVSFEKMESDGKIIYKGVIKDSGNHTTTITVDAENGAVLSENVGPANPPKRLTENEAAKIAQKEVRGKVDDIDLETVNGQTFYLVEIQTADDKEATVQVHAITGTVMSVKWDD